MEKCKLVVSHLIKISQERSLHEQLYCMSTIFQLLTMQALEILLVAFNLSLRWFPTIQLRMA